MTMSRATTRPHGPRGSPPPDTRARSSPGPSRRGPSRRRPRRRRRPHHRPPANPPRKPRPPGDWGPPQSMKLATWNVNSLKVRLPHLVDWLAAHSPDAMCLQETKCADPGFPAAELRAAGYSAVHNGQRAYNGVAILARAAPCEILRGIPAFTDEQSRVIAADVGDVRIVSRYVPNRHSIGSDNDAYKLRSVQ